MQKRSSEQATTLIILISIFSILAQFFTYCLIEVPVVIWGISCLITMLCCHILLEQTGTYYACFNYSLLSLFISFVVIAITYYGDVRIFLPYSSTMLGIAFINWLIPLTHCFLRYMLDYGSKVDDFTEFYRNSHIIFILIYFIIYIYAAFAGNAFPWAYKFTADSANFLPFNIIAAQIENFLYGSALLRDIVIYLASRILIYLPYGFYIGLLLRRTSRLLRYLSLLILPVIVETVQYFFIPARCDIDELLYALFGGLIGIFICFLMNVIYRSFSGRDFLARESDYRGMGHQLHF